MKKFIFTPLWYIEKTEKILSDYEKDGKKLVSIKFPYIFEFKTSEPKEATYLINKFVNGNKNGTISVSLERNLTTEHGFLPINKMETISGFTAYRKVKKGVFSDYKGMRADFFCKLYRDYLISDLIFLVLFSLMFYLSMSGNSEDKGIGLFVTVISFMIITGAYSLFGYIKERKQYKYYSNIIKNR